MPAQDQHLQEGGEDGGGNGVEEQEEDFAEEGHGP